MIIWESFFLISGTGTESTEKFGWWQIMRKNCSIDKKYNVVIIWDIFIFILHELLWTDFVMSFWSENRSSASKTGLGPTSQNFLEPWLWVLMRRASHRWTWLLTIMLCFFFLFFIWVLWPFHEYFTYIESIVHQRWAKTGEPREKPPDHL